MKKIFLILAEMVQKMGGIYGGDTLWTQLSVGTTEFRILEGMEFELGKLIPGETGIGVLGSINTNVTFESSNSTLSYWVQYGAF